MGVGSGFKDGHTPDLGDNIVGEWGTIGVFGKPEPLGEVAGFLWERKPRYSDLPIRN
jgi:hypothetical protein